MKLKSNTLTRGYLYAELHNLCSQIKLECKSSLANMN